MVTIADVLGVTGADRNPHLWYDVPALGRIAGAIAAGLDRADPAHRRAYRAGLARFERSLAPLRREVAAIRARFGGTAVAYTEPVPGYLLSRGRPAQPHAGGVLAGDRGRQRALAAGGGRDDRPLQRAPGAGAARNTQAVSPITTRMRAAARAAGIPVVGVTETLPAGLRFQAWQLGQARALERALRR